jgi:DHA2 family multidrug resistance protein
VRADAAATVEPLPPAARLWGTIAISAATFMTVLDMAIANVALPTIAGDLGVSPNQGTWVITSFAVANAIAMPLTGWLAQRFGQVRVFTASVLLFVIASWLCGLAPNMGMLVAFRAMQGFVAGPLIPLAQSLLLSSYPPALAGLAMSSWSMVNLLAPVVGPVLGGWISETIGWSWVFFINVPVGLATLAGVVFLYRHRESRIVARPIDTVGLALLVLWVTALQVMLDTGKEHGWFESGLVLALAAVSLAAFASFIAWELTDAHPVVDLRLFRRRNFWAGTVAISVGYGLFFGNVVLLPLWLQQYMGYTPVAAGMILAPVGLLAIVISPFVGRNLARVDARKFATVSFLGFAGVLWLRSRFTTDADFYTLLLPTLLQGVAMPFFYVPLSAITIAGLPPERIPAAAGISNFVRITAAAFGTSIATSLWESRAAMHHSQLVERVSSSSHATADALQRLQGAGLSPEQSLGHLNRLVDQQAFMLAAADVFHASAWVFVALVPLVWLAHAQGSVEPASRLPATEAEFR